MASPQREEESANVPPTPTTLAVDAALPVTPAPPNPELEKAREAGQELSGNIAELQGLLAGEATKETDLKAAIPKSAAATDAAQKALAEAKNKRDQANKKCESLLAESKTKAELQELQAKVAEAGLRAKVTVRDSAKSEDKLVYLTKQVEDAQAELEKAKAQSTQEMEAAKAVWVAKEAEVSAEIEKRSKSIEESGAAPSGLAKKKSAGMRKKKGMSAVVERAIELHRKKRETLLYGDGGLKESVDERKQELRDLKKDVKETNNKLKFYSELDAEWEKVKSDVEAGPGNREVRKKEVEDSLAKVKAELTGSEDKEKMDRDTTEREKEEASAQLESVRVQVGAAKERVPTSDAVKSEAAAVVASAKEQKEKANLLAASLQEPIAPPSAEAVASNLARHKKLDERKKEQNTKKKELEKQVGELKKDVKKATKKPEAKKRKRASAALN